MPNPLAAQLRAIADQIEGTPEVTVGPVLQEGEPLNLSREAYAECITDGVFNRDRWVRGDIGAKKGARYNDYLQAITGASFWSGIIPLHMSVLVPPPKPEATWVECLASAGDVGWVPAGATYRPIAGANNYQRWIDAGCPHANAGGVYDRGEYMPVGAWQKVYERMRGQLG